MTSKLIEIRSVLPLPLLFLAAGLVPARVGIAAQASVPAAGVPQLFHTSDQCLACHNGLVASSGEDVSIGFKWRSSMMGNAGRDPYWMAAVRRESLDHPAAVDAIEDKCTVCHLGMARTTAVAKGGQGRAFENFPVLGVGGPHTALAIDGVSCTVCHQIQNINLGVEEGFTGGYSIDLTTGMGNRTVVGPFEVDAGRTRVMESASEFRPVEAAYIQSAEFCANCHTLFTHALDAEGNEAGVLAEQAPYLEWKHSDYPGQATCQDCHMPVVESEVSVTGVLPNPRTDVNRHSFRGGNFLMPRILNKHRAALAVQALPQELEETARAAEENLATKAASVEVVPVGLVDGRLDVDVVITNLAGHKVPSAYPSRRAWIHLTVRDAGGRAVFESGAFQPDGSIVGNDNDADGNRFEPHYLEITEPGQVQIYEDIMVDYAGSVTTGLLLGVEYVKDNRLLPRGFDKATASIYVAVKGEAFADEDFVGGGDTTRYGVSVGNASGPFRVEAEVWYQPIGYRWAQKLGDYDTAESAQFMKFFNGVSSASGALLARDGATIR
ncbi:MAG: hypothetical protein ABIF09_06990 [Gemmatimonadota bacterium]